MKLLSEVLLDSAPELQFSYLIALLTLSYSFSYIFNISVSAMFGIVVSVYVIYEISSRGEEQINNRLTSLTEKLEYLEKVIDESVISQDTQLGLRKNTYIPENQPSVKVKSFLYLDPDLINLLYSIRDYETHAPLIYVKIIRLSNYILKLKKDMRYKGPKGEIALRDCSRNYQVAEKIYKTAVNYFHSFVYNLALNSYYSQKYKNSLVRYRLLMERNLDDMKAICYQQTDGKEFTTSTLLLPRFDQPKPADPEEDLPFHWYS